MGGEIENRQHELIIRALLEARIPEVIKQEKPDFISIDSALGGYCTRLPAIPGIHFPLPRQGQHSTNMDLGHRADDCYENGEALGPALDNGIPVLIILIRDPLNNTPQPFDIPSTPWRKF